MKRNLNKAIKQGRDILNKRPQLDISREDVTNLYERYVKQAAEQGYDYAIWDLMTNSYLAGLAIGSRNA